MLFPLSPGPRRSNFTDAARNSACCPRHTDYGWDHDSGTWKREADETTKRYRLVYMERRSEAGDKREEELKLSEGYFRDRARRKAVAALCQSPPPGWGYRLNFFVSNSVDAEEVRQSMLDRSFDGIAPWDERHTSALFAIAVKVNAYANQTCSTTVSLMVVFPK